MDKINFQNGTLVAKAKVTINGTVYEVEPEEYEGETPLSAEILNEMQDNIENAIPIVVDNLTSTSETDVLSAKQGKILNDKLYSVLEQVTNIDGVKENGKYGIFNATGTLPSGYSTSDNNIIIECIMWNNSYGRQILHDVRSDNTYIRRLDNGIWHSWKKFTIS